MEFYTKEGANIAGEWGHHTLHPNGNECYCGKQGCVETYISGPVLEKRWLEITGKKDSVTINSTRSIWRKS